MKSFGKNLKTLRELNKMSQVQFANKMNTTQQRVSEWECDKVEPSLHNILKMIKVLNTTFDELTDGLEQPLLLLTASWQCQHAKRKNARMQFSCQALQKRFVPLQHARCANRIATIFWYKKSPELLRDFVFLCALTLPTPLPCEV